MTETINRSVVCSGWEAGKGMNRLSMEDFQCNENTLITIMINAYHYTLTEMHRNKTNYEL
jgi:hypothetical protein